MEYQEMVDELILGEVINTEDNPFWYKYCIDGEGKDRYKHEIGKPFDTFYDGNNGDRWRVLAINTEYKRIIVENKTQGGIGFFYWN